MTLVFRGPLLLAALLVCSASAFAAGKKPARDDTPVTKLAPLPAGQSWIDEPMSQWMERATKERVSDLNKVAFMDNGTEFFPIRLEMIRGAKSGDTIDISTFLWCDDPAGLLVAEELARAAERGVRVRAIVDYMNNINGPHDQVYSRLRGAGIPLIEFNPPYWGLDAVNDTRTHEKLMVVNGGLALVGGANLCDEYQLGQNKKLWHDFEMYVAGPAVRSMQARYDENFNNMSDQDYQSRWGYEAVLQDPEHMPHVFRQYPHYNEPTPSIAGPLGNARLLYANQRPYLHRSDSKNFVKMYSELVKRANRRVVIYTPYLVPPREFVEALAVTARRGVHVTVMTNSRWSNDEGGIVALAAFANYGELLSAGVEIREISETALHGKAMLIDDTVLVIGSHNFDFRSFDTQAENSVITGDQAAIAKFSAMAEKEAAAWHRVTPDDVRNAHKGAGLSIESMLGHWFQRFF
jgi:cardiolipin synthase